MADANQGAAVGARFLLGLDGARLAACISHEPLQNPGVETPLRQALEFNGPVRNLKALAIDCAYRGQGGEAANQAMDFALEDMLTAESDAQTLVIARIHRKNGPSQRLAERHGFERVDDLPAPDELENWFTVIEVDEAEEP